MNAPHDLIDGRYRIQSRLGRGGAGTVYKVRDESSGDVLALKLFDPSEPGSRGELSALMELRHASLARLVTVGQDYFTMEHVEGKSLDKVLLPTKSWKEMGLELLSALQAVHEGGWLHGDLKPAHVVVIPGGRIKLLDFGLASRERSGNIRMGGTPGYVAPEILRGQPADVRSDLYACGAILYLMATGHKAFDGSSVQEILLRQASSDPPPPHSLNPRLSRADSDLILKLMQRDPALRPSSAASAMTSLGGESKEARRDLLQSPLLGQDKLIDRLGRLLQSAVGGKGRFILLHGEEGVGRSRLLEQLAGEARILGLRSHVVRIRPWSSTSHQQVIQALSEGLGMNLGNGDEAIRTLQETTPPPGLQTRVLLLDDVQDAEASTLELVEAVAALCARTPLYVVMAWRDGLIHGSAFHSLPSVSRSPAFHDALLPRLDKDSMEAIVRSTLGQDTPPAGLCDKLLEHAQGKPKALREALKTLVDQGSLRFQAGRWICDTPIRLPRSREHDQWLLSRFEKLDDTAKTAVQASALSSQPAPLELLEAVCSSSGAKLLGTLRDLVGAGMLVRREWGWSVPSDFLAKVALESLGPEGRRKFHRQILRIVEKARDPLQRALLCWPHALEAGDSTRAVEELEQAISLLVKGGQEASSIELCRKLLKVAGQDHAKARAQCHLRLGQHHRRLESWEEAARELTMAMTLDPAHASSPRLHLSLALCRLEQGLVKEAQWHLRETRKCGHLDGLDLTLRILEARALSSSDPESAIPILVDACREAEALGEGAALLDATLSLSQLHRERGDLAASDKLLSQAKRRLSDPKARYLIDLETAEVALEDGRAGTAEQVLEDLGSHVSLILEGRKLVLQSRVALAQGDFGRARQFYSRALKILPAPRVDESRDILLETATREADRAYTRTLEWLESEARSADGWSERIATIKTPSETMGTAKSLSSIAAILNSERQLNRLFPLIMDQVVQLMGAERGFLILKEDETKDLRFAAARNIDQKTIAQPSFAVSASLAKQVLETGQAVLTRDALADERFRLSDSIHELKLRSILCCPLRVKERIIGAVYVDNRHLSDRFTRTNLELLECVADQAALAIENARLSERILQQQAQLEKAAKRLAKRGEILEETVARQSKELARVRSTRDVMASLIGESQQMESLRETLRRASGAGLNVLLQGESGTGKNLAARALHELSDRSQGPFEILSCASMNADLMASELFGHIKGAFTGAHANREGLFSRTDGGTLFLDEVDEMPEAMQAQLLRVLESGQFNPVGSTETRDVSVRVIAATTSDLAKRVDQGQFRRDLFFRLAGITLTLPPLRERAEDVPVLFLHFLNETAERYGKPTPTVEPACMAALKALPWSGNVRELRHLSERLVSMEEKTSITPSDVPSYGDFEPENNDFGVQTGSQYKEGRRRILEAFDLKMVTESLRLHAGNVSEAARSVGIERQYFHRIMKRHGLTAKDYRPHPSAP
ncbi:MAG: sigma 54-interacting transcriptional regulator [Planctomycetota bacterium]